MIPKLFAFDLDGTLLDSRKKLSLSNLMAIKEIIDYGSIVALASGRLGSSMNQYCTEELDFPMLTLNGAAIYTGKKDHSRLIYQAPLASEYADYLLNYSKNKNFGINYYINDRLYSIKNEITSRWIDLYFHETSTHYNLIDNFDQFYGKTPSKVLFVGEPSEIDEQENYFREMWKDSVYICRTWDHYLEFLNPNANKGTGLKMLCDAYGIDINQTIAFGDSINDIPMLEMAGIGIAMNNALNQVKASAKRVSPWTNDQNAIAKEWSLIKQSN